MAKKEPMIPAAAYEDYPKADWRYDVANGDTVLGYEDWVRHIVESHEGDKDD